MGQLLQSRLGKRFDNPSIDNWIAAPYDRFNHLDRWHSLIFGTFFGNHPLVEVPHSQAERASIIALAAHRFHRALEDNHVPSDVLHEQRLCMVSTRWLFNTAREPDVGGDKPRCYEDTYHMAVLHRGHAYKVDLQTKDGEEQSYSSLLVEMQAILNDSETDVPSLGTLTTDDGNLWAEVSIVFTEIIN